MDAVEWVEAPNVLGMSQYADGGFLASKPYVASGRYIQRMSNHCRSCRFDPALGDGARQEIRARAEVLRSVAD
ncbi:MAG: hypothetical protein ABI689_04870 [Thermoanaerobaculia bacterium]